MSLDGLRVRRLVNIDAASHPFELILEDDLSVGDAVIEEQIYNTLQFTLQWLLCLVMLFGTVAMNLNSLFKTTILHTNPYCQSLIYHTFKTIPLSIAASILGMTKHTMHQSTKAR